MDYTIYVLLLLALVGFSESLECYSCSNVADMNKCNVTRSCSAGQSCYQNLTTGQHSLGCIDNQNCDSHAAVSTIVGRDLVSREMSSCFECCSTDRCNSALCLHPKPRVCMDDESVDCARLNSIFSICSDVAHARSVCAKFCGLCIVDGNWTSWSTWSKCDVTCENGHQTRTRTCTHPAPKNGGLNCVGDGIMTKVCKKEQPCPVHGGWSDWSHWGTCSVTCDMGLQRRTRTCSNPPPSLAGNHCFGDNSETQLCMPSPCANGGWSDWTSWSSCSATCGGGIRSQTRSCSNPSPSSYGQYCVGSNDRVESCAKNNCVHGGWSDWSNWGSCSVTCGMGLQRRTRTCSNPPPILAGNHCFGDRSETQLCMPSPCANGGWSDWTSWSTCSATCGGGIRTQTRSCSNPSPSPYGQYCVGSNDRVESCANNVCVTNHCSASPCVHGQCYDVSNDFLCYCDHGYEGRYCNISYYYCMSNPCDHGSCVSGFTDYKCKCFEGYIGRNCDLLNATDCYDILHKRLARKSGVYNVFLWRSKVVKEVYCDMETDKGGWTVFQYRFNGSVDFYRNFSDYERGFGSLDGEFWLGLENIYEMVSRGKTELRLDLTAADGTSVYETFQNFILGAMPYYTLHIDKGVGTAGDSLSYHNGSHFSTFDMDRDDTSSNCAITDHGGWWYGNCAIANLNGEYVTPGTQRPVESQGGIIYNDFKHHESLKVSKMMFRRV